MAIKTRQLKYGKDANMSKIKLSNNKKPKTKSDFDSRYKTAVRIFFYIMTVIYGGLCIYLFYRQSVQPLDDNNRYFQSDLPYHISMIIDDGWYYSLTAYAYILLYKMAGGGTVLIAILLGLASVLTVLLTEKLLRVTGVDNIGISCGGALILNLLMPFYVRWVGMYRYASYQGYNVWHNSTYQCMRPAALACILLYIWLEKKYAEKGINWKEWIAMAAALAFCTGIKPSFLTVFAPALAIKLLWDLIKNKVSFKKVLVFGLTVIPACGVILWQNAVLFGADTDNGYEISFMETFSLHADHPKAAVILSLAFPIVIFICILAEYIGKCISEKHLAGIKPYFDRNYIFACLMTFWGFMEAALLIETGSRSRDGNFLWGYAIAMSFLYLVSFKKWHDMLKKRKWVSFGISSAVLMYQLYCGVIFFSKILAGTTYFMYT